MLSDNISHTTKAAYGNKGLIMWIKFLRVSREWPEALLGDKVSYCLQRPSDTDKRRVQMFILYLYDLKQSGITDTGIYCKALANDFIMQGYAEMALLLRSHLIRIARHHGERNEASNRRPVFTKNTAKKDAVSGIMLINLYEIEWKGAIISQDVKVIDKGVACLMGFFMAQFGLRISNLAKVESDRSQILGLPIILSGTLNVLPSILDTHALRVMDLRILMNKVVKACAIRHGLDPDYFSTKSFKNCAISTMQDHKNEMGMNEEEVARSFDHQSVSSSRHYQRKNLNTSGPLGFLSQEGGNFCNHENLEILDEQRRATRIYNNEQMIVTNG